MLQTKLYFGCVYQSIKVSDPMNRTLSLVFAFWALQLLLVADVFAISLQAKLPLSKISTVTVSGRTVLCGLFNGRNKPLPVKRVKGRGSVYRTFRASAAQKAACRNSNESELGTVSLAALPDISTLVGGSNSSAAVGISAVSGTPPVLPDLANLAPENLFWRPGVVNTIASGSPSVGQCSEFFGSSVDGESGGSNACYLAQSVGQSFETVVRSGTSLCYMKNAMTPAMQAAGAVARVSGRFPSNDIRQVFSAPSGNRSRVVSVQAGDGTNMFIRVYSESANTANNDVYRFDFWACEGGPSDPPQEIENTRVKADGSFISSSRSTGSYGTGGSTVTAYLRRGVNDGLEFDRSRNRSAEMAVSRNSDRFKSSLLIDAENIIRTKVNDFASNVSRKGYSVARVSGDSVADLRFLEGAYKETHQLNSDPPHNRFSGIEYRETFYASAPGQAFISELSDVDFTTDPFYQSLDDVGFDSGGYSCSTNPDIVVSMNLDAPAFAPVAAQCEGVRLDGMDFCNSSNAVGAAYNNYRNVCP